MRPYDKLYRDIVAEYAKANIWRENYDQAPIQENKNEIFNNAHERRAKSSSILMKIYQEAYSSKI